MNFVDKASIELIAGKGGNGKLSFRREKFVSKGGPDGGDGGKGGDIILKVNLNQDTLTTFRYQKLIKAENGQDGGRQRRHGKNGPDKILNVPKGTLVMDENGKQIADLTDENQELVIVKGGRGGFGNAHFVSSTRQAPNFAEKGEPGQYGTFVLELKMIADVGLVGLPNAGKSTLLGQISNARPQIANYPFTTLTPNLGMVEVDTRTSFLVADIPGLIAGAAAGKGLGHDFLKHIERTKVIVHLIDANSPDIIKAYQTIRQELKAYKIDLSNRPEIIVLTKCETIDDEVIRGYQTKLKLISKKKEPILAISAVSGLGLRDLIYSISQSLNKVKTKKSATQKPQITIIKLEQADNTWMVSKTGRQFNVSGKKIERFARQTDFNNEDAVTRLKDIMRRQGIIHELNRQKIAAGDKVQIGSEPSQSFNY